MLIANTWLIKTQFHSPWKINKSLVAVWNCMYTNNIGMSMEVYYIITVYEGKKDLHVFLNKKKISPFNMFFK